MKKLLFCLVIFIFYYNFADSQTGWQWINPYPQGNTLEQVQMLNPSTGYAVTTNNAVIKTTNGGVNWSILVVNSSAQLFSVFFTDVNTGYVCGNNGSIYKTINGGTSWVSLQSGTTLYMDQIYFINANTGYFVKQFSFNRVMRTTNGGVNYMELDFNPNFPDYQYEPVTSMDLNTDLFLIRKQRKDVIKIFEYQNQYYFSQLLKEH